MTKSSKVVMVVVLMVVMAALGWLAATVVTARWMMHPITVDLPQRTAEPATVSNGTPQTIDLRVDADNRIYWNKSQVALEELQQRMEAEVRKNPANPPELRIDASPDSEYEVMAKILAQAKNAQMKKIGFVQ